MHWYAISAIAGAIIGLVGGVPLGYHLGMLAKKVLLDEHASIWTPEEITQRMEELRHAKELALYAREQLDKITQCGAS